MSLETLSFGSHFNQPIAKVAWPVSLRHLFLGHRLDQSLARVAWPAGLQRIEFGYNFDQPIEVVVWSCHLETLRFGSSFDQPIFHSTWLPRLVELSLGKEFDQQVIGVAWPPSLRRLSFGRRFNHVQAELQPTDRLYYLAALAAHGLVRAELQLARQLGHGAGSPRERDAQLAQLRKVWWGRMWCGGGSRVGWGWAGGSGDIPRVVHIFPFTAQYTINSRGYGRTPTAEVGI